LKIYIIHSEIQNLHFNLHNSKYKNLWRYRPRKYFAYKSILGLSKT